MSKKDGLHIELIRELGQFAFPEIGLPTGIFWNQDKSMLAIASTVGRPGWGSRQVDEKLLLRHRVTLYEAGSLTKLGVFDVPRFSIHDVAFHPSEKTIAIATGNYDGGWFYEGELLLWNFAQNTYHSLFEERREATRCRFNDAGDTLYFVLSPETDEDEETPITFATDRFNKGTVHLKKLNIISPQKAGFEPVDTKENMDEILKRLAVTIGQVYEPRRLIWDVAWINGNQIAATGETAILEQWDLDGTRKLHIQKTGHGVQLFPFSEEKRVYVNVYDKGNYKDSFKNRGNRILEIDLEKGSSHEVFNPNHSFALSRSSSNSFLLRDTDTLSSNKKGGTRDVILDRDFCKSDYLKLGYYDCFNSYLRIDGEEQIYFLQGTPKNQHENKWICRVDPTTRKSERLFPLDWDTRRGAHLFSYGGCIVRDQRREALVLAAQFWNGAGFLKDAAVLMKRDLGDGKLIWEKRFNSPITAVASMDEKGLILFALAEGKMGLLSALDGKELSIQDVILDDVPDVILTWACQGKEIAAGTVSGRVLNYEVNELDPLS